MCRSLSLTDPYLLPFFSSSHATIYMALDKLYHVYLYTVKAKGLVKRNLLPV